MSGIKNINQTVSKKYYNNFDSIFYGEEKEKLPTTGTYVYDKKTGKLIKIDKNIPKSVKEHMEPLTVNVRKVKPVNVVKKSIKL